MKINILAEAQEDLIDGYWFYRIRKRSWADISFLR